MGDGAPARIRERGALASTTILQRAPVLGRRRPLGEHDEIGAARADSGPGGVFLVGVAVVCVGVVLVGVGLPFVHVFVLVPGAGANRLRVLVLMVLVVMSVPVVVRDGLVCV